MSNPTTTAAPSAPTPDVIFNELTAFQRSSAMKAAIELDIFTAIGEGNKIAAAVARRCRASERGARILCDYLAVNGFLTKIGNEYGLAPAAAAFLDKRSPGYMGSVAGFLQTPDMMNAFAQLADAVRKGTTPLPQEGSISAENPLWVQFARDMAPMMAMPAQQLAQMINGSSKEPIKVLDIAAGHGLYGLAFAQLNPAAKVVGLDWANVLEVAKENARKMGVESRYSTIPGSAFDVPLGSDYDVILLTNFLHHFDPPTNEKLLKKVRAALKPTGRAVTLEFIPNPDRISPPMAAGFSLIMLANTPAGDAYTFAELEKMFRAAGFSRNTLHDLPMSPGRVVVSQA
ncbi:MAG TPA: class I SAM-dependent methyltransferase [Tepidisphaeraceae bacterium]|jgi:2-polyprenyl-3-methyl-5-hydroxy-6-metoxy-1,4-benzoquinol methylase